MKKKLSKEIIPNKTQEEIEKLKEKLSKQKSVLERILKKLQTKKQN